MLEQQEFRPHIDCGDCLEAGVLALFEPPIRAPAPERAHNALQIPRRIWLGMGAAYAVFFSGLAIATAHSGPAIFALVVSLGYAAMYFGTARLLLRVDPRRPEPGRIADNRPLATWTGPMSPAAVAGQVLAIPAALALFAACFAVIATVIA